jgi:hypothetical protein
LLKKVSDGIRTRDRLDHNQQLAPTAPTLDPLFQAEAWQF